MDVPGVSEVRSSSGGRGPIRGIRRAVLGVGLADRPKWRRPAQQWPDRCLITGLATEPPPLFAPSSKDPPPPLFGGSRHSHRWEQHAGPWTGDPGRSRSFQSSASERLHLRLGAVNRGGRHFLYTRSGTTPARCVVTPEVTYFTPLRESLNKKTHRISNEKIEKK